MSWLSRFSILMLLGSVPFLYGETLSKVPRPSTDSQSKHTANNRRQAIRKELGRNHAAIRNLYDLLEQLPQRELDHRGWLENQIHEYDARNDWLFEELDQIDRRSFRRKREQELRAIALKLSKESQLRKKQSTIILDALNDGTWSKLVDREWTCRDTDDAPASVPVQLFVENALLKSELETLKADLQRDSERSSVTPSRSK